MATKQSEFFIYQKDVPKWDTKKKHFYEQNIEVIDFYTKEWDKIVNGVTIDGVYISGWLYFHINHFKTPIPQPDGTEPIINPDLRDNEWYFEENMLEAKRLQRHLFMFGTRRFSKSTLETSALLHSALIYDNSTAEIMCGSDSDLKNIERFLKIGVTNLHPALRMPTIKSDYSTHVQFGYKEFGTGQALPYSDIIIKNADAGKDSSSEKGAGGAPKIVIIDEAAKFHFLKVYRSYQPALQTPYGKKGMILLAATAGNEKLSKDAYKVLADPERYDMMPMNWDILNKRVLPKHRTWRETQFGVFVPAQMAYSEGAIKLKSDLSTYLGVEGKNLSKIPIHVTDWEKMNNMFKEKRKGLENDKESFASERMYYPLDPEDCLASGAKTPFPINEARLHKQKIIEQGDVGRDVEIYKKSDNVLGYELSSLRRTPYPFDGGIHEAPVILFEEPPNVVPERFEVVGGLDPYKAKEADTDSAGAFYLLRRRLDIKQPIETIVACYVARPKTQTFFNRTCEIMMEGWNAETLMENADQSIIQYLEDRHKSYYLAEGIEWAKLINPNTRAKTSIGYAPTPKNKSYILGLVVDYCWEQIDTGEVDSNGNPVYKLGVEFINDPDLLEEIINWRDGGNFDRIVAFGSALAWAKHLDKMNVKPRYKVEDTPENQQKRDKKRAEARMRAYQKVPKIRKI